MQFRPVPQPDQTDLEQQDTQLLGAVPPPTQFLLRKPPRLLPLQQPPLPAPSSLRQPTRQQFRKPWLLYVQPEQRMNTGYPQWQQLPTTPLPALPPLPPSTLFPRPEEYQEPPYVAYAPQQPTPPIEPRRKRGSWLLLVGVAVFIVIIASIIGNSLRSSSQPTVPPQAQATSAPTQELPTAAPTRAVTHGLPKIGGPISDFNGKYGSPDDQGFSNSETWITNQQQRTRIHALADASEKVTSLIVTSGAPWGNVQTKQYCSQFLPPGAQQFNAVSNLTFYHSNAGEIVMQLNPASCTMMLAPP